MIRNKHNIYFGLLFAPSIIALWGYGVVGSFSRMLADDFCSFFYAKRFGLIRSLWYWRLTWSGRYSAYAIDWLMLNVFGAHGIKFIFPLFLVIWIFILTLVIYIVLPSDRLKTKRVFISLLIAIIALFSVLTLTPTIAQSFYWINGMRSYGLPLMVITFYVLLFQIRENILNSGLGFWGSMIIACLLTFLGGGLSETFATLQIVLIAYWLIWHFLVKDSQKTNDKYLLISALLGSILSFLFIITAPGNTIRQTGLPPPPNIINLIFISFRAYGKFIYSIFSAPEKITAFWGALFAMTWLGTLHKNTQLHVSKQIIFYIAGAIILSFVCIPPAVYAYSEIPPDRILSISLYMLLAGIYPAAFLAGTLFSKKSSAQLEFVIVLPAIICLSLSSWLTTYILDQNKQIYQEYAQKWDVVDANILQAKNAGETFINIPNMPNWAYLDQPNTSPEFWATECYSLYYGLQVFGPP